MKIKLVELGTFIEETNTWRKKFVKITKDTVD